MELPVQDVARCVRRTPLTDLIEYNIAVTFVLSDNTVNTLVYAARVAPIGGVEAERAETWEYLEVAENCESYCDDQESSETVG